MPDTDLETQVATCIHWWEIEPADFDNHGPTSLGIFRNCNDEKQFRNFFAIDYGVQMAPNVKSDNQEAPLGHGYHQL